MRYIIFLVVIFHFFNGCVLLSEDILCKGPDWFVCGNGRCLSHSFVCDSEDDCGDFSDEKDCAGFKFKPDVECRADEFRCSDNMCISEDFVCDGNHDCLDSSDETLGCSREHNCTDGFKCKNGFCILTEWKCDGVNDCKDNSDEEDCTHKLSPEECTPERGYFLCANLDCISLKNVCDTRPNCPDGSDEDIDGCRIAEQQCANGTCNHLCNRTPKGAACSCRPGYELLKEKICIDINECLTYGICDQICENFEGSYNCSCKSGYALQDDKRTCKTDLGEAVMIYSSKTDIRGLYLTSQVMFYVARKLQHVVGVSIDTDYVYWSDVQLGDEAIVRSKEDGSEREVIITAGLGIPEDIAVDWVTGNLYFTDGQMQHIAVCTNNGSTCTVIVSEYADKPRGISLLPSKGEMFWSDWGEKPQISRAHMDGKNITPFITENIAWPNGLTIDYPNERLYWVDAKLKIIETVNLDGSDRRIVLHSVAEHPYSIAIFENKLYWSDWKTNSIQSCNKFTGKGHVTVAKEKKSIYGIHIYHSTLKPQMPNPCIHGLCSHICLLAPNATYSCGCPADKELGQDRHSCRVTEKEKKIMVGAGHMFIEVHHEVLGKPKLSAIFLRQDITALTYDPQEGTILASDQLRNIIFQYDPKSGETATLLSTEIGRVSAMDFDNLGRNLYWCDTIFNNIEVYSLNTNERAVISERMEAVPLGLAVIPEHGLMYVVLKSPDGIHIDKMQMSGLGSRTHVIESGLLGPSVSIAYDAHLGRIFWADQGAEMIESTSLEGTDRHRFRSTVQAPVSLAILGNEVFWTSYASKRLYWADKLGNIPGEKKITLGVPDNMEKLYLVAMVHNGKPIQHPCRNANGGCSHICLVVSDQLRMCTCPSGMSLDTDNSTCMTHINCKVYEMKCASDGSCIEKIKKCNGVKDCPKGEDEADCHLESVICGIDHFKCKNGECVPDNTRCDSNYDCTDRSDEDHCEHKSCDGDEFQCRHGKCVSKYSVCDGRRDCMDGSDEENCNDHTCDPERSFACKIGGCIPKSWECDGQVDCADGSDENGECTAVTCSPKMFTCRNNRCIDQLLVCNLVNDCGDGSDERQCSDEAKKTLISCGTDEFRCFGTNKCLPVEARCDGVSNCPMKDDELLCTDCEPGEFTCKNEKCIPMDWRCDHHDDCGDKSDEQDCDVHTAGVEDTNKVAAAHCEEYKCFTGACIPYSSVCNKIADCYDQSDENGRCETACTPKNPCEGICNKTPSGPICSCAKGYRLKSDGFSCEDINECELGMCSQVCQNEMGSFSCSCFAGFLLRSDGRTCKVAGPSMEVVMATKDDIRKISQSVDTVEVIYSESGIGVGINDIDLNIAKKMVYWSSEITGTIFQLSLETKERRNVTKIGKPRAISVDWATDNVYFYDAQSPQAIKICNLEERKFAHVLYINSESIVNVLTVDPANGFIFWGQSDSWSQMKPTSEIHRTDMTGKNPILIASKELGLVSGLAVDHSRGRLYWADRLLHLIERSDLNGNDRSIVFSSNVHRPYGLNLFEDSLFWLTPGTGKMTSCSLFGGNQTCREIQISASHNEEHFAIMQLSRQPSVNNNICEAHNCSNMCVINKGGIGCLCQNGTVIPMNEVCSNVTILQAPDFGPPISDKYEGGYVAGVFTTIFLCIIMLAAYYYYQKKKLDAGKCDLSIHFQNPNFGCDPIILPNANSLMIPPGEHEYINPIVEIRSKIPETAVPTKRTLQLKDAEDIVTSESEDGNYLPDAQLIR